MTFLSGRGLGEVHNIPRRLSGILIKNKELEKLNIPDIQEDGSAFVAQNPTNPLEGEPC